MLASPSSFVVAAADDLAEVAQLIRMPTTITGTPRSLAVFGWSPATLPRPPE
jgi:hypothetical protein